MSQVTQILETTDGEGKGTITAITISDDGKEHASTREYNDKGGVGWDSKGEATEKAIQDSLNK